MIEILTKIRVKITIISVENRESYHFIIICKCKEVPLSLLSYQMLASTLTTDEWPIYYKVYGFAYSRFKNILQILYFCIFFFLIPEETLLKRGFIQG